VTSASVVVYNVNLTAADCIPLPPALDDYNVRLSSLLTDV